MYSDRRGLPRVLTWTHAQRLGITESAWRHGVRAYGWRRLAHGAVLTRDEDPTRDDWAALGLELSGPRAALSGWDAVRLSGLGARTPPNPTVLILDSTGKNRRVGPVLIRPTCRRYTSELLPAGHPTLAYAPVVTTPRAVADTALFYRSFDPVRALVTSSIQRQRCTAAELVTELEHCPGRVAAGSAARSPTSS